MCQMHENSRSAQNFSSVKRPLLTSQEARVQWSAAGGKKIRVADSFDCAGTTSSHMCLCLIATKQSPALGILLHVAGGKSVRAL